MISTLIRFLYYILFFLTPFVMVPATSELFEFNKMMLIYFAAASVAFLWGLRMIKEKRIIWARTSLDIPILLFLTALVFSTLFSIDKHTSFFGYYGRFNGGLISIIAYFTLYYGFISNVIEDRQAFVIKLLKSSLIASFLVILWGLPARLLGWDATCALFTGQFNAGCWTEQFDPAVRMFSTLGQPNWLGAYLAIHFFFALFFYLKSFKDKNFWKSKFTYILLAYLFVNFSAILFTRSRSALLAAAAGAFVVAILHTRFRKGEKGFFVKTGAVLVLCIISVLLFKSGVSQIDKFTTLNTEPVSRVAPAPVSSPTSEVSESFDIRKIVWEGAWKLGLRYPWFGTGVETFAYSYYFTRPQSHNLTSEWDFIYNKAHNEYLNYLATTGFVGLGTYLLLIGTVLYLLIKELRITNNELRIKTKNSEEVDASRLLTICLFASYITILITNFFGFSTTTVQIFFFLLPAFIVPRANLRENKNKSTAHRALLAYPKVSTTILFFAYAYVLFLIIQYIGADIYYAKAKSYGRILEHSKAHTYYQKALNMRTEHVYEDAFSYNSANLAFLTSGGKDPTLSRDLTELAQILNARSLTASPYNVLYYKTRAKNNYLFYQVDSDKKYLEDGIDALTTGIKLSPTDPRLFYTRAVFYDVTSDSVEADKKNGYQQLAVADLTAAILLKPDYRDAYLLKGQLLKKYGRKEEARQAFEYILKHLDAQDEETIQEIQNF